MDSKPLLQDRPPAYSPAGGGGGAYEYGGPNSYGAIPAPQPGFQMPPPYTYPAGPGAAFPYMVTSGVVGLPFITSLSQPCRLGDAGYCRKDISRAPVGESPSNRISIPMSGYAVPSGPSPHNYPNTTYTIIQQPTTTTSVVVVGGCPACRVGVLEDTFTCLGVLCAIFFFPIGILFCLALRQRRCPNCGATFG